jgi:hypothetical protein
MIEKVYEHRVRGTVVWTSRQISMSAPPQDLAAL